MGKILEEGTWQLTPVVPLKNLYIERLGGLSVMEWKESDTLLKVVGLALDNLRTGL